MIKISGADRVSFLNRILSSDVTALKDQHAQLSALLTQKGKIQSFFWMFTSNNAVWVELSSPYINETIDTLKKYALRQDVYFEAFPETWNVHHFNSQQKDALLQDFPDAIWTQKDFAHQTLFALYLPKKMPLNSQPIDYENFRMTQGVPYLGKDIGTDHFPLESTFLTQAVSFTKGCYLGQETMARLHARGEKLSRKLKGFLSEKPLSEGTQIYLDQKAVGEITSANENLGLGLLHRSAFSHSSLLGKKDSTTFKLRVIDLPQGEHV